MMASAAAKPVRTGSHTFTAEEIIAFAREFDPQPFHVDPAAAEKSHFGGLIASGWHVVCVSMRLMLDERARERQANPGRPERRAGPSPGWRDIVWHKPNPLPESVEDRPTRAHEFLFLFAKSERYFYDAAAIAEPSVSGRPNGNKRRKKLNLFRLKLPCA